MTTSEISWAKLRRDNESHALLLRLLMGDANTQRKEHQVRLCNWEATTETARLTKLHSCCLYVAAFLKYFPIARPRHVTRCAVTPHIQHSNNNLVCKVSLQEVTWYGI